jgi:hypothetical protein
MDLINQLGNTDMMLMASYPNFLPVFTSIEIVRAGSESSPLRYVDINQRLLETLAAPGAVVWNPSTREVWLAGADTKQIRKYDEWLTNIDDPNTLVTILESGNNTIYGGCHLGATGVGLFRDVILNTFLVIAGGTKIFAIDMQSGFVSKWFDTATQNTEIGISRIVDICQLSATTQRGPGAAIIGTLENGRYFIGEIYGVNAIKIWNTLDADVTTDIPGGTRTTKQVYVGLGPSGAASVYVCQENWQDDVFFEELDNPFGGTQHFESTGRCIVRRFSRGVFDGDPIQGANVLFSYDIPIRVSTIIQNNGFDPPFTSDINIDREGGGIKTWAIDSQSNSGTQPRVLHYRGRCGLFYFTPVDNEIPFAAVPFLNLTSAAGYRYSKWWSTGIIENQTAQLSGGGYTNLLINGLGTAPRYLM